MINQHRLIERTEKPQNLRRKESHYILMISNSFRASDHQNRDNWIILLTERAPIWPNAFAIHYVNAAMTIARATVLVFVLRWRVVTNISQQGIRAP